MAALSRKTDNGQRKVALITGITGQDGSYLAELLLDKGYDVAGTVRKTSHLEYPNIGPFQHRLRLYQADLIDAVSIGAVIRQVMPDEIYNLASQSSPAESFKQPIHTALVTALGPHLIYEAVKDYCPGAKVYQASSSEMFGKVKEKPQGEETPYFPQNPYAVTKIYAHYMGHVYRDSYHLFICLGTLFNHESPRRNLKFVTQKVAYAAACAKLGIRTSPYLNEEGKPIINNGVVGMGNLDAVRDWGFAGDYVDGMWRMMQQEKPDDYILATGIGHTVEDLCAACFSCVDKNWRDFVRVEQPLVRPAETGPLIGDYSKANRQLGWQPTINFQQLVKMMVYANVDRLK